MGAVMSNAAMNILVHVEQDVLRKTAKIGSMHCKLENSTRI